MKSHKITLGLDTCILSELLNVQEKNQSKINKIVTFIKEKVQKVIIPTIVLSEFYLHLSKEEFKKIEDTLKNRSTLIVAPFDEISALEIKSFNQKIDTDRSRQAVKIDFLICACCKAYGCTHFLTNDKDLILILKSLEPLLIPIQEDELSEGQTELF